MEEVFNNNNNSTPKTSNRDVNLEIMVIDDGEEPSKSKIESETIIKIEELFTSQIPRVPPFFRNHENNKGMFDPKVVSIGPYHHGKEDLQLVENVKPMVATLFLQDSGKNMDEVYSMILEKVDDARSCYDKRSTDEYSREQFAKMMLLDGCFILAIIEDFLLFVADQKSKYDDVRHHLGRGVWISTFSEIFFLLENQLPFQVLVLLMSLKFKEEEGMKSVNALLNYLVCVDTRFAENKEKVSVDKTDWESLHLLQLMRTKFLNLKNSLHIFESQMGEKKEKGKFHCKQSLKDYLFRFVKKRKDSKPKHNLMEYFHSFRSVTELKARGIYFTPNSSLSLEAIEFKSCCFYGRLELHPFLVSPETKLFYSNVLAYEMVSSNIYKGPVITGYIDFMKTLIDNQDDVKELRSKHILINGLGSDQEVANVFKELIIPFVSSIRTYRHVKEGIQDHYNSTVKTWIAECINKYFSRPWTAIAFVAATGLFVLSFLQTYYTISPPHSPHTP